MIKKIATSLLSLFLIFSLVGCGNKAEKKEIDAINIDFKVNTVDNGTVKFDYPADEWEEIEYPSPAVPVMLLPKDAEDMNVNINITKSSDKEASLEKILETIPDLYEKISPNITVDLAEIRTINGMEIAYNENSVKFTEENIEKGLKNGVFTEEAIEANGGKEALLNMPEQKQIQMTMDLDDKQVSITGTYLDDSQKEMVLKAMTTMAQTAKLK